MSAPSTVRRENGYRRRPGHHRMHRRRNHGLPARKIGYGSSKAANSSASSPSNLTWTSASTWVDHPDANRYLRQKHARTAAWPMVVAEKANRAGAGAARLGFRACVLPVPAAGAILPCSQSGGGRHMAPTKYQDEMGLLAAGSRSAGHWFPAIQAAPGYSDRRASRGQGQER